MSDHSKPNLAVSHLDFSLHHSAQQGQRAFINILFPKILKGICVVIVKMNHKISLEKNPPIMIQYINGYSRETDAMSAVQSQCLLQTMALFPETPLSQL